MAAKVFAIAVCVVVAITIAGVTGATGATAPTSRPVGYSVTINATAIAKVLATGDYEVSLEGEPCAITVRHLYSNAVGHLLWTANYFVGSLETSTKCTLTFTTSGDLQLFALFMGTYRMIWNSDTAGKGITHMALENVFDSGDFQLLNAQNKIVYHSFGVPEFAILPTQKFTPGRILYSATKFNNDSYNQVLFTYRIYSLKLQSGDLRLFSDFGGGGPGEKQYWSLQRTLYKGDLSKVAYAGIVPKVGGLGLFEADGSAVYTTGPLELIGRESNPHDTYFSVEPDGNLRTYFLVKGEFWSQDFQAIPTNCDMPSYCGAYSLCSKNTTCSCPPSFTPNFPKDLTQGCNPVVPFATCGPSNRFQRLTGYDYLYNQYATPLHVSLAACNTKCLQDCTCKAYFFTQNTGLCYLTNEVRTLKKVSDNNKLAFIRL